MLMLSAGGEVNTKEQMNTRAWKLFGISIKLPTLSTFKGFIKTLLCVLAFYLIIFEAKVVFGVGWPNNVARNVCIM